MFKDWGDDPFGGGVNFWKIGYNSQEIARDMIQPVAGIPVYICGEAYSNNQGWVEGALETATLVLQNLIEPANTLAAQVRKSEIQIPKSESDQHIAITGAGWCLAANVRGNEDPIFTWLYEHGYPPNHGMFVGFKERRVLPEPSSLREPPVNVADLMIAAARQALEQAQTPPDHVDVLVGWASISEFLTPNLLVVVHRELRLRPDAWLLPIEGLENFSTSLWTADALIKSGRAGTALIVSGCNWSRFVDYHTPASFTVGDGAGAMVLSRAGKPGLFSVLDGGTLVMDSGYGAMYMQGDEVPGSQGKAWGPPYFHITSRGVDAFNDFGRRGPADLGKHLLQRHNISGANVTLISHQASRVLMDFWKQEINPGQYIDTLAEYGNMIAATVPINFAMHQDKIAKDYVLFLNPSAELKAVAVLLKRNVPERAARSASCSRTNNLHKSPGGAVGVPALAGLWKTADRLKPVLQPAHALRSTSGRQPRSDSHMSMTAFYCAAA